MSRIIRAIHLAQISAIALLAILLPGCNSQTKAIDRMVEELNSPEFRASEARTGLFSDSQATISSDTLSITFFCCRHISLAAITNAQLPQLQASATEECRGMLNNERFKQGMEALRDNGMTMLFVWQDVHGNRVALPLDPAAVLTGEPAGQSLQPVSKP